VLVQEAVMKGPRLRIVASCDQCEYMAVETYSVQGDSGRDVSCTHPTQPDKNNGGYIGEKRFDSTPQWCPLLKEALHEFTRGNPVHKVNP
jgi:hypothetical protein